MKAGWKVNPLGEAATFIMGQAPAGSDCNKDGKGTPFVKAGEFGERRPVIREWTTNPKKFAKETDVLICVVGATCGKINLGADCAIGRSAAAIRPHPQTLNQFYLHYYLEGQVEKFRAGSTGAAQTVISRDMLGAMPLPLPPLEEQQQIVAVLDEAFEGLARARTHAEANLRDARELLANTIDSLMASDGTAPEQRLGDLCTFENGDRGKNYPGRKAFVPSGVPFINAGHLLNGPIDWENMNFIPLAHFNRLSNGKVRQGDLLFCLRGSLGKFGTVDSAEPGAIASSLVIVRPADRLLPEYLAAYFESSRCAEMIESYENGAAQPNLSAKSLAAFTIVLPDLEAQSKVVSAVAEIRQSADQLCRAYETKLNDIDALRQSLLQKAFAGELT